MYICRHCGLEYVTDEAALCPRCQAPKGKGENFCPFCGTQVTAEQKICMSCGVDMEHYGMVGGKSKIAAGLLAIFFGKYGIHNFYLGYIKKAVIQLVAVIVSYILCFSSIFSVLFFEMPYYYYTTPISSIVKILLFLAILIGIRIWTFIEGILILCGKIERDGKGQILQ